MSSCLVLSGGATTSSSPAGSLLTLSRLQRMNHLQDLAHLLNCSPDYYKPPKKYKITHWQMILKNKEWNVITISWRVKRWSRLIRAEQKSEQAEVQTELCPPTGTFRSSRAPQIQTLILIHTRKICCSLRWTSTPPQLLPVSNIRLKLCMYTALCWNHNRHSEKKRHHR